MIDLAFVKRLIETVESSDIDTLEISRWGTKIRISKNPAVIGGETVNLAALGGTKPANCVNPQVWADRSITTDGSPA